MNIMSENGIVSRCGSALSYLTAGWGGLILFVLFYFAKIKPSKFFQFNAFQSIFISFAVAVICMAYGIIFNILSHIWGIQKIITALDFLINKSYIFGYSLFQLIMLIYMIYVVTFSLLAKYPSIYKISKLISKNVR